jgi:hypothetical protein
MIDAMESFGLNVDDIRRQGYDNGSNMKEKHQGIQKRLIDINPGHCICHVLAIVSILLFVIWQNLVRRLLHFLKLFNAYMCYFLVLRKGEMF